jgi:hypothetical protein
MGLAYSGLLVRYETCRKVYKYLIIPINNPVLSWSLAACNIVLLSTSLCMKLTQIPLGPSTNCYTSAQYLQCDLEQALNNSLIPSIVRMPLTWMLLCISQLNVEFVEVFWIFKVVN